MRITRLGGLFHSRSSSSGHSQRIGSRFVLPGLAVSIVLPSAATCGPTACFLSSRWTPTTRQGGFTAGTRA